MSALDAKILTEDEEVEVLQAEEVNSLITTAKNKITHCLAPLASTHSRHTEPRESSDTATRLLKLDLPQFSGNPLY